MISKLIAGTLTVVLGLATAVGGMAGADSIAGAMPLPQDDKPPVAWIGALIVNVTPQVAERLQLDVDSGVVVAKVLKDSPAAAAGLQDKDLVKAVGGQPVAQAKDARQAIAQATIGQPLTITVLRGTQEQQVTVTPTEVPAKVKNFFKAAGRLAARRNVAQRNARLNKLPGWEDIPKEERFSHTLGSTFRYKDVSGNVITVQTIPGAVVSASATSLTITPNDPALSGGPYTITEDTAVRVGKDVGVESLQPGDQVQIVTADGQTALAVTKVGPRPTKPPASGE